MSFTSVDLTDESAVFDLIRKVRPTDVYHLAGMAVTSGVDFQHYYSVNVLGTGNIARAVLTVCGSAARVLYVSSAAVYGSAVPGQAGVVETQSLKPKNSYGVSKTWAEALLWPLWRQGLNVRIARPFNHTGPGQQRGFVCPDLADRIRKAVDGHTHATIRLSQAGTVRDFTDVRDVVRAYTLIMGRFDSGEVVNVASGVGHSLKDIVNVLSDLATSGRDVRLTISTDQENTESDVLIGNSGLLRSRTGWSPNIPLRRTLEEMWTNGERKDD